jgi:hypothetical protein
LLGKDLDEYRTKVGIERAVPSLRLVVKGDEGEQ